MIASGISRMVVMNVTCTNADTEYSQLLPEYCAYFSIKCRDANDLKLSFSLGDSGTNYILLPSGSNYSHYIQFVGSKALYFQTPTAGAVVEIVAAVS